MIKKIILFGVTMVFALGILGTSVYRVSAEVVADSLEAVSEPKATESMAESEAASESRKPVEYALTWPGILPDHFLYPVKMFRDRIWLFFTTDSLKRAELLLKLADKRLWAAKMLAEKGKDDLAATTAAKAERYLERTHEQARVAQEKGQDMKAFWGRFLLSTQKHEEVLMEAKGKASGSAEEAFGKALDYPRRLHQQASGEQGK